MLVAESDYVVLRSRVSEQLLPLLDGRHSTGEIVALLDGVAPAAEVYFALLLLEREGYLTERTEGLPPDEAAFWEALQVDASEAARRLQQTRVAVTAFGEAPAEPFLAALKSLHIQVDPQGEQRIVLTDSYLREELAAFNRQAIAERRPYLLLKPAGSTLWLGPLFQPGRTGCWECLAHRLRAHRPAEVFFRKQQEGRLTLPGLPSTLQAAVGLAATEVARWIVSGASALEGAVLSFDLITLEKQRHVLTHRPQCPCCGDAASWLSREPVPLALARNQPVRATDGGSRTAAPEETLRRYGHHVSPITGVVRSLRRLTPGDDPLIHAVTAAHRTGLDTDTLRYLRRNARDASGGKGKSAIQAEASGLCEAIERYSGIFQGDEIRIRGRYMDLAPQAIHPNTCMNFSAAQYAGRQARNQQNGSRFQHVPEPFDEHEAVEWTPVWSLTNQAFRLLPTAYCYFDYPGPASQVCPADSNGNAAGNTLEEAILQGFMELVERDAVALWWYSRVQRPAVDLAAFEDPYFHALTERYSALGRDLWVLDVTSDLGIPAFAAVSRRINSSAEEILLGFGAHFDARIAVTRALTEVNQLLASLSYLTEGGGRRLASDFPDLAWWWKTATLENQPYLAPRAGLAPLDALHYAPLRSGNDLCNDVRTCVRIAREHGLETLVLDQTRPDIGLPVARVFVPGLRHFWQRLGPGRLYDAPVALGWLPESLKEDELNPVPMSL